MPKEDLRYLQNAKEILKSAPIEDNTYTDIKPAREVFGTAYLAVLEAINEEFISKTTPYANVVIIRLDRIIQSSFGFPDRVGE